MHRLDGMITITFLRQRMLHFLPRSSHFVTACFRVYSRSGPLLDIILCF